MLSFAKSRLAGINLFLLIALFLFAANPVLSQVTIHVPGDYSTIQAGINAAQNGDMVLVDDGTYLENINFKGKAITIASNFIMNGDTNHINNTIIDGSQPNHPDSGSVVYFISGEDTNSVLCGFTITGGTGTYYPVLPFSVRIGGGILCFNSGATIKYNRIKYNSLEIGLPDAFTMGGGIFCGPPPPIPGLYTIIKKNIIYGNNILTTGSASNWQMSWAQGGGVALYTDGLVSNNDIYSNHCESIYGYGVGGGIRLLGGTTKIINNNIDLNSSISINSRGFAGGISCSAANAIIDSNRITNNYISGALGCRGAAIYFDLDNDAYWAVVKNNYISGNYHTNGICYGGAIGMYTSSPDIYNNVITNNSANYGGALSALDNSKPKIINNTITNNTAIQSGGALYLEDLTTNPIIINSILWNNGSEIYPSNSTDVMVYYSDIEGGWTGTGTNNIDTIPHFEDPANFDFHLQDISPCIGAGVDSIEIAGIWYYAPSYDFEGDPRHNLAGSNPDIGADEDSLDSPVYVEKYESLMPIEYALHQNYPNPFNPSTTIEFALPNAGFVTIKIYDVLGSEVAALVNEEKPVGNYQVEFDASNLSSGIYFYRIQAGSFVETKKMILLR